MFHHVAMICTRNNGLECDTIIETATKEATLAGAESHKRSLRDMGFARNELITFYLEGPDASEASDEAEMRMRDKPFGRKALAKLATDFNLTVATIV